MIDLGTTLASGVRLLRGLPRGHAQVQQARQTAAAWAADHPELKAELVVDERPGTSVVDFDLLLQDPEGGTIALTARAGDGIPWLIDHSTHWAGRLVSVDEIHLSVAQALTMIRSLSCRDATPHDEIVDQCLILNEIQHDDTPVSDEDLQAASEEFRRERGLHDRATTPAWPAEMGMTLQQFDAYIGDIARRRSFRRRREAELGPAYLAAHAERFDRVRALWSIGPEQVLADLGGDSPEGLLPALAGPAGEVETTIAERFAFELPEPLQEGAPGDVVGPTAHGTAFLAGVILGRAASSADERTLAAAGRVAFTEWLAERRATASIEWHWS